MPVNRNGHLLHLHIIVFIWGFSAILGKMITVNAVSIVAYRMGLAVLGLALWVALSQKRKKKEGQLTPEAPTLPLEPKPGQNLAVESQDSTTPSAQPKSRKVTSAMRIKFVLAGLLIGLHWITFFGAIKVSNVAVCLAMMSTGSLFTSIINPLYNKKQPVYYEILLGLCVAATLFYVFQVEGDYWWGVALGLVSASMSALFAVINADWVQHYPADRISLWELAGGASLVIVILLVLPLFGLDYDFLTLAAPTALTAMDWLWLGLLAGLCTSYAFVASTHVMKWLSPFTVMLTINLEPVYGILLAWIIFGESETMTPTFYYGAIAILAVLIINGYLKQRDRKRMAAG